MTLQVLNPAWDPAWPEYLRLFPSSGLFHSQQWIRSVSDGCGLPVSGYVTRDQSGEPQRLIAFSEIDDFVGRRIVSLPFSDACDPLVKSSAAWRQFLVALQSKGVPVASRWIGENRLHPSGPLALVKTA